MRRFLLGLLFFSLCGAVAGAVLTWPESASDPARNSPTLSEFQNGVRTSQFADTTKQSSPASAAQPEHIQPEHMQRAETRIAAPAARAQAEARDPLDSAPDMSGRTYRVASTGSLRQMLSAGENVPESGMPRLQLPIAPPDVSRQEDRPTEAIVLASTTPVQAAAPAVERTPEPGPPAMLARPPAIGIVEAPPQDDPPAADPVVALATEQPRTRTSNEPATNAAHQTLIASRHGERIAIHYHSDIRSRSDAQRISGRLGSAGLSTVEMHSTAHVVPLSLVRYFSRQDASAAVSLAKGLGTRTTDWHVDDCTAYQHKPERGTIQLWPATVATRP
jgi:hypothetical protein